MATILIVDDDEMLLSLTKEMLEVLGHKVYSAENGEEALAELERHGAETDLVFLDLSLPDTDGLELSPNIAKAYPGLKIILCSGSVCNESKESLAQRGVAGYLQKPYDLNILRDTLERYDVRA